MLSQGGLSLRGNPGDSDGFLDSESGRVTGLLRVDYRRCRGASVTGAVCGGYAGGVAT